MTALTTTLDRVAARHARVDWRKVGLTLLFAIPFALFYLARIIVRSAGWVLSYLWAAGMVGWEAAGPRRSEDPL